VCEDKLNRKFIDMGITPGVEIEVIKQSPFGDPIQIRLRGYDLLIRKDYAKYILM
jgi:ferrous iron transport protein A